MKPQFLGALALLAGAGWAAAQAPSPTNPYPAPALTAPVNGPPATANGPPMVANGPPAVANGPMTPGLTQAVNGYQPGGSSVYFSADYLLWRVREGAIPPTATSVPVGVVPITPSNLFLPFTPAGAPTVGVTQFVPVSVISTAQFGPRSTDFGSLNGFRLTGGWWADQDRSFGIEASYFMLARGTDQFSAQKAGPGTPFQINTGVANSIFVVNPTIITTSTGATFVGPNDVSLQSQTPILLTRQTVAQTVGSSAVNLYSAELNARCVGLQFGCVDFGGLVGGRWIRFNDQLTVDSRVSLTRPAGVLDPTPVTFADPLNITTHDQIRVYNDFIGAQVGADVDAKFGPFFIYSRFKMGVGTIIQHADVASSTTISGSPTVAGGNLFGPGDVGSHDKSRFGFIDELNLKFGYQITDYFRAYVGYDGLYLGHFARAGASSTTNSLNTSVQVAGTTNNVSLSAPAFRFGQQDVWVQGLSFGFLVNF